MTSLNFQRIRQNNANSTFYISFSEVCVFLIKYKVVIEIEGSIYACRIAAAAGIEPISLGI